MGRNAAKQCLQDFHNAATCTQEFTAVVTTSQNLYKAGPMVMYSIMYRREAHKASALT